MEAILHIGIAQFVFAGILVLTKKPRHLSDIILGLWLFLMTIFMGLSLLKEISSEGLWERLQMFPFAYTFGPFVYLYVKKLTVEKPGIKWTDTLHAIPFLVFSAISVFMDIPVDEEILDGNPFRPARLVFSLSLIASFAVYCILTIILLKKHQENIQNHFSYESDQISLRWLKVVAGWFSAILGLTAIIVLINATMGGMLLNPGILLFLGFTVFAFGVTFYGVRQQAIYRAKRLDDRVEDKIAEEIGMEEESLEEDKENAKYARSSLTRQLAKQYVERLIAYMEKDRAYLRRDLNINDVATDLGVPQHHLTQAINEELNRNFYHFVNEYRVEDVKVRLLDPQNDHFTLLAIAHDAGFNSKSSFNMIFKKFTGMTPSEFRRKNEA